MGDKDSSTHGLVPQRLHKQVVSVTKLAVTQSDAIVAICVRGKAAQAIPIPGLPLPCPWPAGAEWIDAYRRWRGGSTTRCMRKALKIVSD